jgi:hypothetical protein
MWFSCRSSPRVLRTRDSLVYKTMQFERYKSKLTQYFKGDKRNGDNGMKGSNKTRKWSIYNGLSSILNSVLCNVTHQLQYLNKNEQIYILQAEVQEKLTSTFGAIYRDVQQFR